MANGEVDTDVRSAKKAEDFVPEFLGFHIATIGVQYLLSIFIHSLHPATKKNYGILYLTIIYLHSLIRTAHSFVIAQNKQSKTINIVYLKQIPKVLLGSYMCLKIAK